jgi:hypothetical protein
VEVPAVVYNEYSLYNPYYDGYYEYDTFGSVDEAYAYYDPDGWWSERRSSILIPPFFSVFFI